MPRTDLAGQSLPKLVLLSKKMPVKSLTGIWKSVLESRLHRPSSTDLAGTFCQIKPDIYIYIYIYIMINGSKISIHRFIATALFRMVKEWPHSSGNINEWPLNYTNWQLRANFRLLWYIKTVAMIYKNNGILKLKSRVTKRLRYLITKFLSRYLFLWRHELASSFRLFRLHKFFL